MKYLILIWSLTIVSLAFSQPVADTTNCIPLLKTADFTTVKTVQEIAPWVFLKFPEWEQMVNPGKKITTSEKKSSGPKRRLLFAAHSGDNWIISYEHSRHDHHAHCIFITVNERNEISVFDACNEFKTLEELKTTSSTVNPLFEKWDEHEY